MPLTLQRGYWAGSAGGSEATLESQLTMTSDNGDNWHSHFATGCLWHPTTLRQPYATFGGQMDCCRVSSVNRYSSASSVNDTISIPSAEFSYDSDTLYLMNFNNADLTTPDSPSISASGSTSSRNTTNTMFDSAGAWEGDGQLIGGSTYLYYGANPSSIIDLRWDDEWTFESFFYQDSDDDAFMGIMSNYYTNPQFWFGTDSYADDPPVTSFSWWTGGLSWYEIKSTTSLTLDTWYFYAITNTTGGVLSSFLGEV